MKRESGRTTTAILMITGFVLLSLILLTILFIVKKDGQLINILLSTALLVSFSIIGVLTVFLFRRKRITNNSLANSLNSIENTNEEVFEVGTILFDENQKIIFMSPWLYQEGFEKYLGKSIDELAINTKTNKSQTIKVGNHSWDVDVSLKTNSLLLKDTSSIEILKETINSLQNAVLSLHASYSQKLNFNESKKSEAKLKINQVLQDWANKVGGVFNSLTNLENTSTIIFQWTNGDKEVLQEALYKKVKDAISTFKGDITISLGVAYGDISLSEIYDKSLKSLEFSKNRGGDQTVLEKSTGEIIYIGAKTTTKITSDNLATKKFYSKLSEQINSAKDIIITSHRNADLDAIGSTLGMLSLLRTEGKETYVVLDELDSSTDRLFRMLPRDIRNSFISEREAIEKITKRTLIIILDTSIAAMTQAPELISKSLLENILVIDHHRISENTIELGEEQQLINTASSSTSEIIVEILKMTSTNQNNLNIGSSVATALLAGIQLDSKKLTKNVSDSTFEAVSFLMKNEANIDEANNYFKPSQKLINIEKKILKNITKIRRDVIFTWMDENTLIEEEETSIIADRLLSYQEIEAVFVLAKVSKDKYKLSARSNEGINVQLICESLGGGGHFNSSAAAWKSTIKYNTVQKRVVDAIQKGIK